MITHNFMMWAFWIWLVVAIWFVGFLIGRIVGFREGWRDAKTLYKGNWE